jgi:hypothetical protein
MTLLISSKGMQSALYNAKHLKDSIVKKGVASYLMFLNSSLGDYNISGLYVV